MAIGRARPTTSTAPLATADSIAAGVRKPPVSISGIFVAALARSANSRKLASRASVEALSPTIAGDS